MSTLQAGSAPRTFFSVVRASDHLSGREPKALLIRCSFSRYLLLALTRNSAGVAKLTEAVHYCARATCESSVVLQPFALVSMRIVSLESAVASGVMWV